MSQETPPLTERDTPAVPLAAAIEDLYRAFKRYQIDCLTDHCAYGVTANDVTQLEATPLRSLLPSDLERFAQSAMTTWGSVADFKHFLPRILELVALAKNLPFLIEIAIGKLAYGEWQLWPQSEQLAVRHFLKYWWLYLLSIPITETIYSSPVETAICSIGRAENDLADYLAWWRNSPSVAGTFHLADFIHHNHACLLKRKELKNNFWENPPMEQVITWLCEPETGQQLESAFYQVGDESAKASLSLAVQEWEWLRVRCS